MFNLKVTDAKFTERTRHGSPSVRERNSLQVNLGFYSVHAYLINPSMSPFHRVKCTLPYDVTSGSEITPCNKIDKTTSGLFVTVVNRFFGKRYGIHYTVAYIMTKV